MSYMDQADFARVGGIQELNLAETEEVQGGLVPLALAAAALATTVEFSFVIGVFAGIREKAASSR